MHALFRVVDICECLIERAQNAGKHSSRTYHGHGLFLKAVLHGRSMLTLIVSNGVTDVGAVCVLARCVMEAGNAAMYLLENGLSKDEAHLRLHLLLLNHSTDLQRIHVYLGTNGNSWSTMSRHWSLSELARNPIFTAQDDLHRKNLLRGKAPYLHNRYAGPRLITKAVESGLYTLFSQSTHSLSLGLPLGGGQITPVGSDNSLMLAADVGALYLSSFAPIYWRLRHKAIKILHSEERAFLRDQSSSSYLIARLEKIKKMGSDIFFADHTRS